MRSRVFQHLGLKLVSLVLGFSLWYIVAGGQGAEIVFSIPLEYRNVPEGLEVLEESVKQVDVRLRGTSEILRGLSARDIEASVALSDAQPGQHNFYLRPEDVVVPFGVRVMRVSPAAVRLQLDRAAKRKVQIVPRVVGSPAAGFELAGVSLESPDIEVAGPASRLEILEKVTTAPVSAEGLREPYTQMVQVVLDDPNVRPVDARGVEVTLDVQEERLRRTLSGVVLLSRPASVNARLPMRSIRVEVEGPKRLVEQIRSEDLEAEVNVEGLGSGIHRVKPRPVFRRSELSGVDILSVTPEEVRVRITAPEGR